MTTTNPALRTTDTGDALIPARRHDLDWLRVLAFGLLILYHIGMLYVERWGFHYKSAYLSGSLESIMLIINPWRMLILWLISGVAIRFILARLSVWRFVGLRSLRLLLPLLFGILVIVPPQLFVEMSQAGVIEMSYRQFLQLFWISDHPIFAEYDSGILPHIDVNHLWYLRELWTFSILLCVALPILNSGFIRRGVHALCARPGVLLGLMLLPIVLIDALLDGDRTVLGAWFLLLGYLFAFEQDLWDRIRQARRRMMAMAVVTTVLILLVYYLFWIHGSDQMPAALSLLAGLVYSACRLFWVVGLLGLAAAHLDRPSPRLVQLNRAVYPCYIVHQTLLIVAAWWLTPYRLGPVLEPLCVLLITVTGCALTVGLLSHARLIRPLFGQPSSIAWSPAWRRLNGAVLSLVLLLFALELLL